LEKIEYNVICLSVVNFVNYNQKEQLKLIYKVTGINLNINNESSIIRMYFGYITDKIYLEKIK
jgi:hypothetical protein